MSEWKYAVNTRVDIGENLEETFKVHTGTIVGRYAKPDGTRYYQVKFDGSLSASHDGNFPAKMVEKWWKEIK